MCVLMLTVNFKKTNSKLHEKVHTHVNRVQKVDGTRDAESQRDPIVDLSAFGHGLDRLIGDDLDNQECNQR